MTRLNSYLFRRYGRGLVGCLDSFILVIGDWFLRLVALTSILGVTAAIVAALAWWVSL